MLNNSGESEHLCLVPNLRGNAFSLSPLRINVCCRLIIDGLYYVEVDSFYDHFLKSFNYKWVMNFVKGFTASIEIIIWFLSFNLLIWCVTLISLHMLEESLHSWNKPNLTMVYELFNVLLISVC